MCGRYVPPDEAAMERSWRIDRRNWQGWITPRFNVAPTTVVPIIRRAPDGAIELLGARWGLIPSWWKKETPPNLTFNARSEDAAEKPTWRQSLRSMRCLMPARGWYEWNEHQTVRNASGRLVKQPYFISCPASEVIAFAALCSVWRPPGGEQELSCALLSKDAAPAIAGIHQRMPVVLAPDQHAAWLDAATSPDAVAQLIAAARQDFAGYPVSPRVGDTHNDSPDLLLEVEVAAGDTKAAR